MRKNTTVEISDQNNELFNYVSHLVGGVLAVAGAVVLILLAARGREPVRIVAISVYAATLVLLFFSSALYHFMSWLGSKATPVFQRIDHGAIYFLIAGSYTPLCLLVLRGAWGWSLFGAVWGLAAIGVLLKIFRKNVDDNLSYALYGIMGWLAVVAIVPMWRSLGSSGLALLFAGGVSYSIGGILLAMKTPRLWPGVFSFHELWHLFVMAGSGFHFWLILSRA